MREANHSSLRCVHPTHAFLGAQRCDEIRGGHAGAFLFLHRWRRALCSACECSFSSPFWLRTGRSDLVAPSLVVSTARVYRVSLTHTAPFMSPSGATGSWKGSRPRTLACTQAPAYRDASVLFCRKGALYSCRHGLGVRGTTARVPDVGPMEANVLTRSMASV